MDFVGFQLKRVSRSEIVNSISALAASDRCIYILGFAEYIILYVADEFMTKPIGIETIVSHIACDKDTFC